MGGLAGNVIRLAFQDRPISHFLLSNQPCANAEAMADWSADHSAALYRTGAFLGIDKLQTACKDGSNVGVAVQYSPQNYSIELDILFNARKHTNTQTQTHNN